MAAGFEDVIETDEVALDVGIGVGDAVADAGLCCEVDNDAGLVFLEEAVDAGLVGDVVLDECPVPPHGFYLRETFLLEVDVIVFVHGVDADDLDVLDVFEKPHHEVAADEAGGSGHENGFSFEGNVVL